MSEEKLDNLNTENETDMPVNENSEITEHIQQEKNEEKECCNPKKKHSKCVIMFGIISLLSLIGVIILFLFTFCCNSSCQSSQNNVAPKIIQNGDLKIAYINTDSIMANYEYAKDLEKGLKAYQQQLESNYEAQGRKLKSDIENYMKTGDQLTLTEQKKKEEELGRRQQEFPMLQQNMMTKLSEKQVEDNKKLINAIYAFIKDYNAKNGKYNVILSKSYINSPVLYIDEGFDITKEIIDGLNQEYKNIKK